MPPEVSVLRLGHRPERDKRVTTHVCLVARAFGARRVILTAPDASVERSVKGVVRRFGGDFEVVVKRQWRDLVRGFPGPSVHLTMYGERHRGVAPQLARATEVLLIVGAEKVPGEVFGMATYNVGVGNQPHSEVAAVSTLLYEVLGPDPLERVLPGGELRIEPAGRGKRVISSFRTAGRGA